MLKAPVFGVFLIRIFPYTRKPPNADTFDAVLGVALICFLILSLILKEAHLSIKKVCSKFNPLNFMCAIFGESDIQKKDILHVEGIMVQVFFERGIYYFLVSNILSDSTTQINIFIMV